MMEFKVAPRPPSRSTIVRAGHFQSTENSDMVNSLLRSIDSNGHLRVPHILALSVKALEPLIIKDRI